MPTMTNADKIRAMSDEQLAALITAIMSRQRATIMQQLQAAGVADNISVVEMPTMTMAAHLAWLREPA